MDQSNVCRAIAFESLKGAGNTGCTTLFCRCFVTGLKSMKIFQRLGNPRPPSPARISNAISRAETGRAQMLEGKEFRYVCAILVTPLPKCPVLPPGHSRLLGLWKGSVLTFSAGAYGYSIFQLFVSHELCA